MTIVYSIPAVRNAWADTATPWNGTSGQITDPGNSFVSQGWTASSSPPPYQYFNWVLNWTGAAVRYFMQNGIVDWQAAELYQTGSIVVYNNLVFQSLTNSNTGNTPPSSLVANANWGPLTGYATILMLASYVTQAQLNTDLAAYAALNSPSLVGVPLAPTANAGTSTNQLATTAFVTAAVSALGISGYLTIANAAATYLTIANAAATYLTQSGAASTYLTISTAAATYCTQLFAKGTYSFGTSGSYQIFPSGLIEQFGVAVAAAGVVTFPIPFPSQALAINCTSFTNQSLNINSFTLNGFTYSTGAGVNFWYTAKGH